jgi:F-type H+-transporting ATPase subunit a
LASIPPETGGYAPELSGFGGMIVSKLYSLTEDALDKEKAKKYAPLITALFMFLLLCNWIGMVPHMHEPTKDLNTPLSLGIMGFFIAHYAGIKSKGIKGVSQRVL